VAPNEAVVKKIVDKGIVAPLDFRQPPDLEATPDAGLQLEFLYGYRGRDTRDNLRYNANGEIVFT
jgi:hypothetical protein